MLRHPKTRLAVCLALAAVLLTGCGGGRATGGKDSAQRSQEMTAGEFPEKVPPSPVAPPPPSLKTPKSAILSYLLWISYAYRVLDSTPAEPAMSVWQEVRVNSYVELNKQEGKAIDQRLVSLEIRKIETQGATATVDAKELWRYRYIDAKTGEYSGPAYDAGYETRYTVVNTPPKGWLVDKVKVMATDQEIK